MGSKWRQRAVEIIKRTALENDWATPEEMKKALSAAYPFGPRNYHPYKIWLECVKEFLAFKFGTVARKGKAIRFEELPMFSFDHPGSPLYDATAIELADVCPGEFDIEIEVTQCLE